MVPAVRPIHQSPLTCSIISSAPNLCLTAVSRNGCIELKAQNIELLGSILRAVAVTTLETFHATTGIHQLLTTGVERVALIAQLDMEISLG
jgi:hypothetical protein